MKRNVSMIDISSQFNVPIIAASEELGISVSLIKKICREHGVRRWPRRKIVHLEQKIQTKEQLKPLTSHEGQMINAEIRLLKEQKIEATTFRIKKSLTKTTCQTNETSLHNTEESTPTELQHQQHQHQHQHQQQPPTQHQRRVTDYSSFSPKDEENTSHPLPWLNNSTPDCYTNSNLASDSLANTNTDCNDKMKYSSSPFTKSPLSCSLPSVYSSRNTHSIHFLLNSDTNPSFTSLMDRFLNPTQPTTTTQLNDSLL
jgi:hypothetical protein